MPQKLKTWILQKMVNIFLCTTKEVIHTQYLSTSVQQALAEMRTNKTSTAGYQNTFHNKPLKLFYLRCLVPLKKKVQ
jgi:hypothetical protein